MSDDNKRNLVYFENRSMRGLFENMEAWQGENRKRILSLSINRDGDCFCCIAATNPTEVIIADGGGDSFAFVRNGHVGVHNY